MNKYRNIKHGNYDSRKEAKRGAELALLEKAGAITELQEQKIFVLIPRQMHNGKVKERAVTYIADFAFRDRNGVLHVEDVKSDYTRKLPAYVLKRKMLLYFHDIALEEI